MIKYQYHVHHFITNVNLEIPSEWIWILKNEFQKETKRSLLLPWYQNLESIDSHFQTLVLTPTINSNLETQLVVELKVDSKNLDPNWYNNAAKQNKNLHKSLPYLIPIRPNCHCGFRPRRKKYAKLSKSQFANQILCCFAPNWVLIDVGVYIYDVFMDCHTDVYEAVYHTRVPVTSSI